MDGPYISCAFHEKVNKPLYENFDTKLLNVGSLN